MFFSLIVSIVISCCSDSPSPPDVSLFVIFLIKALVYPTAYPGKETYLIKSVTDVRVCLLPVFTVDNLEVHVDSGDKHLTVDANLVDCRWRQGMSYHHHPHDVIRHRAAVCQSHPDPQTPCNMDHLKGKAQQNDVRGSDDGESLKGCKKLLFTL